MNMAKIEARADELHEGCGMPTEQARELAASEASPDWYARGQDWALADAMSESLPNEWTCGDIARAFAAGAAACDAVNRHERQRLRADLEDHLRHVIDMTNGEHYFDAVRENSAALLKRLPSVLAHNVEFIGRTRSAGTQG